MGQPTTPPAGDLICVLVRLQKYGADRFYVLRWPELQPHGAPGNAHRALPGQLVALRRVHGGLED